MVGFWMQVVGQALLVLEMTDNGFILGFAAALQFLPALVVGPWAGLLSDRLDKRRLMIMTHLATATSALVLGVLVLTDTHSLLSVLLLSASVGCTFAFDQPARRTIVTELVDEDDIANAVSLSGTVGNLAKLIGPGVAALIVSATDIGWCFVGNALASSIAVVLLATIDGGSIRRSEPIPRERGQIRQGYSYLWNQWALRTTLVLLGVIAVLSFNWNVLLPLLVTRDLGGSATAFGFLMSLMAIGSVTGLVWLARVQNVNTELLGASAAGLGVTSLLLAAAPNLVAAAVFAVGVGLTSMVLFNAGIVILQLGATPSLRGRVMASFTIVFLGSHGLGGPLSGAIAERWGARVAMAVGGTIALAAGGHVLLAARRRPLRRLPADASVPEPPPASVEVI